MSKPLVIRDVEVLPGNNTQVRIPVGQLPSGNQISILAHVYRAVKEGPVVLVLAGIHGDEVNSIEIVRRTIEQGLFERLQCGSVIAIPLLNVFGFINFSRDVPDGKDVNRSFPGAKTGSLAARVAHVLHQHILPLADFALDFHTGGGGNYNYPQIRYSPIDAKAKQLAEAFNAPVTLAYPAPPQSLRKVAREKHQLPVVVFEGGENLRYDGLSIQKGLEGIQRVLVWQGMLAAPKVNDLQGLHFTKTTWQRAPRGGLFQWLKCSGNQVQKGEPLGFIADPYGGKSRFVVTAQHSGFIIGHNNTTVVSQGDALFHVALNP